MEEEVYLRQRLLHGPCILETQHMFDIAQICLKNSGLIITPKKNSNLYTLPLLGVRC